MKKMKAVITDKRHKSDHIERSVLEPLGIAVESYLLTSEAEIIQHCFDADALLVSHAAITRKIFESLKKLKIVIKYGIGTDNIDKVAAKEFGVIVSNVPRFCVEEVACQALNFILDGIRKTSFFSSNVKKGIWLDDPSSQYISNPSKSTLGIVGYGNIGRYLQKISSRIFNRIIVFDPYIGPGKGNDSVGPDSRGVEFVHSLEELFSTADAISIHTPLTDETRGSIDYPLLKMMNHGILVNTSRAQVIDRDALERALEEGKIDYFGADVFWNEPCDYTDPRDIHLISDPRVVITPHSGWYSKYSEEYVRRNAAEEVSRVLLGQDPHNRVA
jgi:D-3-phosphoglycerate dehydrogenase